MMAFGTAAGTDGYPPTSCPGVFEEGIAGHDLLQRQPSTSAARCAAARRLRPGVTGG
jgi:hypothetical protein